jgi:hypothetical protein
MSIRIEILLTHRCSVQARRHALDVFIQALLHIRIESQQAQCKAQRMCCSLRDCFNVTTQGEEKDPTSYPAKRKMNMFPGIADVIFSKLPNGATLSTHP